MAYPIIPKLTFNNSWFMLKLCTIRVYLKRFSIRKFLKYLPLKILFFKMFSLWIIDNILIPFHFEINNFLNLFLTRYTIFFNHF